MIQSLIIDDSEFFRNFLQGILEENGIKVDKAYNGEMGLKMLRRNLYHVVFCDMVMQPLGGADVLEAIEREGLPCPIIVMMSATPSLLKEMEDTYSRNWVRCLPKPMDENDIMDVIFKRR